MSNYFENIANVLALSTQDGISDFITEQQKEQIKQALPSKTDPELFTSSTNTPSIPIEQANALEEKVELMPKQDRVLNKGESLTAAIKDSPTSDSQVYKASK